MTLFRPAQEERASSLALGLAHYLTQAARTMSTTPVAAQVLQRAIEALIAGLEQGHACVLLAEVFGETAGDARASLLASGVVNTVQSLTPAPLMLDDQGRLYLYRYFDYERRLALALVRLCGMPSEELAQSGAALLQTLFAANAVTLAPGERDWQQIAAALALRRRLTVISGGPGTGKTTTVVAILTSLLSAQPDITIALAAPTGKAAARLQSALRLRWDSVPADLREHLPADTFTLHKLLGTRSHSTITRYHSGARLPLDVLIVDEASMLDLALATRLVEAMPDEGRLILLGDKDQLAAVEPGAVFNTLATYGRVDPAYADQLLQSGALPAVNASALDCAKGTGLAGTAVWLQHSYRFAVDQGIGQLATAVRDFDLAAPVLPASILSNDQVSFHECAPGPLTGAHLARLLAGYEPYIECLTRAACRPEDVLPLLERYCVLCAVRRGPRGTERLNAELTQRVMLRLGTSHRRSDLWYAGRPVLVTGNDYALRLYNGDVGVVWPDEDGLFSAWFAEQAGGVRSVPVTRLPAHETAFCLTVHKCQGSEYAHVALVMPGETASIMTRELVYTAVTRARTAVEIFGSQAQFGAAVARTAQRGGGLSQRLREAVAERGMAGSAAEQSKVQSLRDPQQARPPCGLDTKND